MSFASLLDYTARVWRPTVTHTGPLREEVRTFAVVGDPVACSVRRPTARLGDVGPGVAAIGERVLYFLASADVRERDVIELVTGPDSGRYEIDAPPTRPRGHHVEAVGRHFAGVLP